MKLRNKYIWGNITVGDAAKLYLAWRAWRWLAPVAGESVVGIVEKEFKGNK